MITIQPVDVENAVAGSDVIFTVSAMGGELSYRWFRNEDDLENTPFRYAGTDSNSLTVFSVNDPDDEGMYKVIIGNLAGTAMSEYAMLTIGRFVYVLYNFCLLLTE